MKTIQLQNSLIGEQNKIDIDTICLTKQHRVVKVKSFSGSRLGYCYAVHSWCLDDMFKNPFNFGRLADMPRHGYVYNLHKITALTPIASLKLGSFYEFQYKYGNEALTDLLIMQGLVRSFKPENNMSEKETAKKIKEAANVLRDLIEYKMNSNDLFVQ